MDNKIILHKRKLRRLQLLNEMAKAKDRTIDKKLWATMSSQCSRTYKATLGEFARVPSNASTDVLLQKYVAGIIIFKCPCPTNPAEMEAIKAYKSYGEELLSRGISFDTIQKLYNENAPDSLIGQSVNNTSTNELQTLDNVTRNTEQLTDTEVDDIAAEIEDLKDMPSANNRKLSQIEDRLPDTPDEIDVDLNNRTPLSDISSYLKSNNIEFDVVGLTESRAGYEPFNILWTNYQRGMERVQSVLGLDESSKFIHFSLDNARIKNNMRSLNIRITRLFDLANMSGTSNYNIFEDLFGRENEYGMQEARLVMQREFFVGPRTVQESIRNLVYKLGTANIIVQYNSKDLIDRNPTAFEYDKVTFYIQYN